MNPARNKANRAEAASGRRLTLVRAPRVQFMAPAVPAPSADEGADALLELLTDLWADQIVVALRGSGDPRALTAPAGSGLDGGEEAGPPRRANAETIPDPQRDSARAGCPGE